MKSNVNFGMKGVRTPKANPRLIDSAFVSETPSSIYPLRLDIRTSKSPLSYSRPVMPRITSPENTHQRSYTDSDYLLRERISGMKSPESSAKYQPVETDTGNLFLAEISRLESIVAENRAAEQVWRQKERDMANRITLLIAENERLSGLVDQYAAEAEDWKTKYVQLVGGPENNTAFLLQQRQDLEYEVDRLNEAVVQKKRELNLISKNRLEDLIEFQSSGKHSKSVVSSVRPSTRDDFGGVIEGEKRQIEEIERRALKAVEGQGKEIETLKSAYHQLRQKFSEVCTENERLQAIGNKENEIPQIKRSARPNEDKRFEALMRENESLKRALEVFQNEKEKLTMRLGEVESVQTRVKGLQEKINLLSSENIQLKGGNYKGIQIFNAEGDIERERDMLKERIKELEEIVKSTLGLKDKIMLLADQNEFLVNELEAKEAQIRELSEKIFFNEREIKYSADFENKAALLNTERDGLKKLLLEKEGEVALWKMKSGQFEEQVASLRLEGEAYKAELKEVQKRFSGIQAQKESLNELYVKNEKELKEANNNVIDYLRMAGEKEELKNKLTQSLLEIESLNAKLEQYLNQITNLEEKNKATKESQDHIFQQKKEVEENLRLLGSENLRLKNNIRDQYADQDVLEQELRKKVRDLDIDRLRLQDEIKTLERRLASAELEYKSLEEVVASQRVELENRNDSILSEQKKTQEQISLLQIMAQESQTLKSRLNSLMKENEYLNMKSDAQKTEQFERSELQGKAKLLMAENERLHVIIESKEVYKVQVEELQSRCDSLKDENSRLINEVNLLNILKKERDEYQEKIRVLIGEKAQLEGKLRSLDMTNAEKQSLEQRTEQLILENTSLQKTLIAKNEEILQINELREKINLLIAENMKLNNLLAENKSANDELQKIYEMQRNQLEELKREYLESETQNDHLSHQKESLTRLNQNLEERLRLKDGESHELAQSIQNNLKTTNELQIKLKYENENLKMTEKELSNDNLVLNSQIKKMSAEEKRLNDLIQDQMKQIDTWEKKFFKLEAEKMSLQGSYPTIEILTQEQERLLDSFEQKVLENENLRNKIHDLEKEFTSVLILRESVSGLTHENKELRELTETYQHEILQLKIKEGDIELQKMDNEQLRRNSERLAEEKEDLINLKFEHEREIQSWKSKYQILIQEKQGLEQEIGTLTKENTYLNNMSSQKLSEIDKLKKDTLNTEELQFKVASLEQRLSFFTSEKEKLGSILDNTNQELMQIRQQNQKSLSELQLEKETVSKLNIEITFWKDRYNQAEKALAKMEAVENKLLELIHENERLNQRISLGTQEYRDKEQMILGLRSQVEQLQKEKLKNSSEISSVQSDLRNQIEQLEKEKQKNSDLILFQNNQIDQLHSDRLKASSDVTSIQNNLRNQIEQLQKERLLQNEEISRLRLQNTTPIKVASKMNEESEEREKRNSKMIQQKSQDDNKVIADLKHENERLERQTSDLVIELQSLRSRSSPQARERKSSLKNGAPQIYVTPTLPTNQSNELIQILGESSRHIENLNQELERRSLDRLNLRESQFRMNEVRSDFVKSTIYNNFEELNSELEGEEEESFNEQEPHLEELEEEDKIGLLVEEIEKLNGRLLQKNRMIEEYKSRIMNLEDLLKRSESTKQNYLQELSNENQRLKLILQSQEKELEVLKIQNVTFERSYRESVDENEYEDELTKKVITLSSEVARLNKLLAERDDDVRIKAFEATKNLGAQSQESYIASLEKQVIDLSSQIKKVEQVILQLKNENSILKNQLNKSTILQSPSSESVEGRIIEILKIRIVLMCAEIERLSPLKSM